MGKNPQKRSRIVVIGGGFGGLQAARSLGGADASITLIDRRNHHLFQPMLYQVATAGLSPSDIASPIRSILRRHKNINVVMGEVGSVDTKARQIELVDGSSIGYDYLIVAAGARHSYFGHDEWEALAPGLKNIDDALEVRRRVLLAFEAAERETDAKKRQEYLTFVVVGGGPTGAEVAGALAELRSFALKRDFRHIDPGEATILLLEGAPDILNSYPRHLRDRAKRQLRRLEVVVKTETFVTDITPGTVSATGWTIPTRTVVWAAGNQASPMLKSLGAPLDRQGRVVVEPDCSIPEHPEVFVIGDAAAFTHEGEEALPGLSPVAIQMGRFVARAIRNDLAGRPRKAFRYNDKGQLAVIGRGRAIADIHGFTFAGFFAWLVWAMVHIFFLIGFRNRAIVMMQWAWQYLTYQQGARLITGVTRRAWESQTGSRPRTPEVAGMAGGDD